MSFDRFSSTAFTKTEMKLREASYEVREARYEVREASVA